MCLAVQKNFGTVDFSYKKKPSRDFSIYLGTLFQNCTFFDPAGPCLKGRFFFSFFRGIYSIHGQWWLFLFKISTRKQNKKNKKKPKQQYKPLIFKAFSNLISFSHCYARVGIWD